MQRPKKLHATAEKFKIKLLYDVVADLTKVRSCYGSNRIKFEV